MINYYIYALICPMDNIVKYVGCSKDPEQRLRASFNYRTVENKRKFEWFNLLKKDNNYPIIEILSNSTDIDIAIEEEQFYISKYRNTIFNAQHKVKYRG